MSTLQKTLKQTFAPPKNQQRFEYRVVGKMRDGVRVPVPFEQKQPKLDIGEVVGTGTVAPNVPIMEMRHEPTTQSQGWVIMAEFTPADERYAFLDIGHIAAKLATGEFAAVPITDDDV